jgi:hypothetical protein
MTWLARTGLAFAVFVLTTSAVLAQSGGLTVVVTDAQGGPLPGATVTVSHRTGAVKTTAELSDTRGVVDFPVLSPGTGYSIQVAFPGFASVRFDDIRVKLGENQVLPVQLLEELAEQVRVSAEREVIALEKSETSTKFTDDFIQDLPVPGRFYQNILTMAPGVQDADGDGNPNVHGSRSRDFQAVVGGVSNVDPLTGQWMSRVNPNSIEEIEVITAGAGVEFGRAQGGYANIIQKQGSNEHEGVFEFYWQTSKLDGDAGDTLTGDGEFETIQPLFQLSGPIVRDRLWYRVSYEQRNREEPIDVLTGVETFSEDTETQDYQLTWQVSPRNKIALQYRSDPWERSNVGISNLVPVEAARKQDRDVETYTLTWTAPYSPKLLVRSTVAWQELNPSEEPNSQGVKNSCVPNSREPFLQTAQCLNLQNNITTGSYFRTDSDRRQRLTVKSQATIYAGRLWGMNHQVKFGLSIENERYFRTLTRTPSITFEEIEPVLNDDPIPTAEPFGLALTRLSVPQTDDVRATGTNWGVYIEDQIKPMQNLTVTLGARVDREEINSDGRSQFDPAFELQDFETGGQAPPGFPDPGIFWPVYFTGYEDFAAFESQLQALLCSGVSPDEIGNCFLDVANSINSQNQLSLEKRRRSESINITNTNVSPFLSVAWSPGSDGKTAIKAAAGRHYNNIPLIVPLQELEPVQTDVEYRVNLVTLETEIAGSIDPTLNIRTVDRNLKTPYQDEFTFSIERALWPETSIALTYINRQFRDQLQDQNINVATGDYGSCPSPELIFTGNPIIPRPGGGEGSGVFLVDPYTLEVYEDTDPGVGDGRLDDCTGRLDEFDTGGSSADPFGADIIRIPRPDGETDLYLQNPFWGDILEVSNLNEIEYEAFVLELVRRQYRSWEMNASYTWSEATGDGEDFFQELGNDPSLRNNIQGFQSYDQRHVVKVNATSITPWGVRLGTSVSWQSGLPYSVLTQQTSLDTLPPTTFAFGSQGSRLRQRYVTGTRNDQRNDSYWNVDMKATKEFRFGKGVNLQLSAEVFNVFDDDTYIIWNGFTEEGVQLNGLNEAFRRFGRQWQVGMRLAF